MNKSLPAALAEKLWIGRNRRLQAVALVVGSLIAINLVLYVAVVRHLAADITERESRNAGLRKKYAAALLFQQQKKTIGGFAASVPSQRDMPLLVKELQQTARRLNLRVGAINYDIPRPGSAGVALLSFSFPVTGRYADLKRFIYEVETSGRLVGIESIELKSGKGAVDLDLKLVTCVRGQ